MTRSHSAPAKRQSAAQVLAGERGRQAAKGRTVIRALSVAMEKSWVLPQRWRSREDGLMEQSITVEIAAPPERVWEVMSDVEQWSEWTSTVTSVRRLDEGPLRTGSRAKISQPRIPETEYVVTDLEPGRSFTWVAAGPGVLTTASHALEPLAGGGARVRLSVSQSGPLGSVMGRFYRGLTDRYLSDEAIGLKARCEEQR